MPITDNAAIQAILLYLSSEHPIIGAFDADLFVEDLISKRLRYCSHLLVSSMLCWACVSQSHSNSCHALILKLSMLIELSIRLFPQML